MTIILEKKINKEIKKLGLEVYNLGIVIQENIITRKILEITKTMKEERLKYLLGSKKK